MKAAFVSPSLNVGGAERQWSLLVPGLLRRGVASEVFTLDGTGRFFDELTEQGIPTRCLQLRGRWNALGAMRAARAIAGGDPDVIVSTGVSAHVVGELASRFSRASHIAAIHAMPEHPESFKGRRRSFVRLLAPGVSASTAVTTAQLDLIESLGFDRARTHVIPNGVPEARPTSPRNEVRAELGVNPEAFVALLMASLRPEKRVDRFVEAVVSARSGDDAIRGFVAGTGPELAYVRSLSARSDGAVVALGPRVDAAELISAADVVCLTSDAEALPLVVLEAMAGARPVVATDVGGVRDAVVDGETGYVVAPEAAGAIAERIVRLATDRELATRLGQAGLRRQRDHFTGEQMVDAHYDLFRQVATGKQTSSSPSTR